MRKSTRWILGTLAAASVASGAAWAGHHEGGHGKGMAKGHDHGAKMFDKRDADGDGTVTREEWLAASEDRFDEMDADGDGAVTRDEAKAARAKMRERWKEKKKAMSEGDEE